MTTTTTTDVVEDIRTSGSVSSNKGSNRGKGSNSRCEPYLSIRNRVPLNRSAWPCHSTRSKVHLQCRTGIRLVEVASRM